MSPAIAMDRDRMIEACNQAANLYGELARDKIARGTASALRAAAGELAKAVPAPAAPSHSPSARPSDDLVMVVSALLALRDPAHGGWFIDDETMTRLERAHRPHQAAARVKSRDQRGPSRDD